MPYKALYLVGTLIIVSVLGITGTQRFTPTSAAQTTLSTNLTPPTQAASPDACFGSGCHTRFDTAGAVSTHAPFAKGECDQCHAADPHHQMNTWTTAEKLALCHTCHSVKSLGYSHPIGAGVIDPNTGTEITCLTCHSPHYTDHLYQLVLDGRGELCVHCHTEFLSGSN